MNLNFAGNCDCVNGGTFINGGICSTIVGCISAIDVSGSITCLACSEALNF